MLENCQHRNIADEHVGLQVGQILLPGNVGDVPHEEAGHPEPLVVLFDGEGEFGTASRRVRFDREIAGAADDYLVVPRSNRDQEGNLTIEVRARDPFQFSVADICLVAEETSIGRIVIEISEGSPDPGTVIGAGRPQGDGRTIPEVSLNT